MMISVMMTMIEGDGDDDQGDYHDQCDDGDDYYDYCEESDDGACQNMATMQSRCLRSTWLS